MSGQTQDDSPTGRPSDVALQMGPLLSSPAIPAYRAQQSSSLPLSKANTADCAEMDQVAAAAAAASRRARGPVVLFDQGDRPSGQSRPSVQRGLGQWTSMKSRFTAEEAAKGPGSDFEAPGTAKFAEERTTAQNYFQIKQNLRVSNKVKEQLHMFDEDGDGVLNVDEVAAMVEYLFEEQSKRKMYQWAAIALVTFTLVLLASIFGLTWAVVAALKDTKITQQVLVTKQGIPVQTASTEYMLDSTGLLTPRNLTTQNDANPAVRTGGYVGVQGDLHSELDLNTLLEMNVFHVADSSNHELALRVMGVMRRPNQYNPNVTTLVIMTYLGNVTIEGTTIVGMSSGVEAALLQAGFQLATGVGRRRLLADVSTRGFFNIYTASPNVPAPDTPSPVVPDHSWKVNANDKLSAFWASKEHGLGFDNSGNEVPDVLRNMWVDWCQNYPNLANPGDSIAYRNFVRNMQEVRRVNLDLTLPYWASGNGFSYLSFEQFSALYTGANVPGSNGRRSALEAGPIYNGDNLHLFPEAAAAAASINFAAGTADYHHRSLQGNGNGNGKGHNPKPTSAPTPAPIPPSPPPASPAPCPSPCNTINWVQRGVVTPIRNQGGCGSCWAFASVAAIESTYLIAGLGNVNTLDLSEQQLISCATGYGCSGGWVDQGLNYFDSQAVVRETDWPNTYSNGTCTTSLFQGPNSGNAVQTNGTTTAVSPSNSESALIDAVMQSPTPFLMNTDYSFQVYAGGIYKPTTCTTNVNHAMLLVGYEWDGTTSTFFWRVKNSWGNTWGEQGYMRIAVAGSDGTGPCGMYQFAYRPPSTFVPGVQVL